MNKRTMLAGMTCAALIIGLLGRVAAETHYREFDYVTENVWDGGTSEIPVQPVSPAPPAAPQPGPSQPQAPSPAPAPALAPAPAPGPRPNPDFSVAISPRSKLFLNRIFVNDLNSLQVREVESYKYEDHSLQVDRREDFTITLRSENGFEGDVSLSVEGVPGNATYSIPASVGLSENGSAVASLVVRIARSTPMDKYTLTVKGCSGGLSRSDSATLYVTELLGRVGGFKSGPVYDGGSVGQGVTRRYTVDYSNPILEVDNVPYINYLNDELREESKMLARSLLAVNDGPSVLSELANKAEDVFVNAANTLAYTTMNVVGTTINAIDTSVNELQTIVFLSPVPIPTKTATAQIASAAVGSAKISNSNITTNSATSSPAPASATSLQISTSSSSGTLIGSVVPPVVRAPITSAPAPSSPAPRSDPQTPVSSNLASAKASAPASPAKSQAATTVTNLTTAVQNIASTTKSPQTASVANLALFTLRILGIGMR